MLSAAVETEDFLLDVLSESWLNRLNEFWIMKNLGVISGMALTQHQTAASRLVLASRKGTENKNAGRGMNTVIVEI